MTIRCVEPSGYRGEQSFAFMESRDVPDSYGAFLLAKFPGWFERVGLEGGEGGGAVEGPTGGAPLSKSLEAPPRSKVPRPRQK